MSQKQLGKHIIQCFRQVTMFLICVQGCVSAIACLSHLGLSTTVSKTLKIILGSPLHLMDAIAYAHTSRHTTSLMQVKNSMHHFCLWNLFWGTLEQTLVNLSFAWMLHFHVWLQNKEKFLVWSEYYSQFGIYQLSQVSLLESQQSNLSNPEAYSELCQTYNMECFPKIVNGYNLFSAASRHFLGIPFSWS